MNNNNVALSCTSMIFAIVVPLMLFLIGSVGWGLRAGFVLAGVSFLLFLIFAGYLLATAKNLSWFGVFAPFTFGVLYAIFPDLMPLLPFDDAAVATAGAISTFALAMHKNPDTPRWILMPLLASALYTLVGALIPLPVDELLVFLIGGGVAAMKASSSASSGSMPATSNPVLLSDSEANTIDVTPTEL
jgi:hypothetical protein